MKTCLVFLSMLAALVVPCQSQAQDTTYSQEISVREKYAIRLKDVVKNLENRKTMLEKSEKEYKRLLNAKIQVDWKMNEFLRNVREQGGSSRVFDRSYMDERNRLTRSLGLTAPGGRQSIREYPDLLRWISVYEKDLLKRKQELAQIDKELLKARADLDRTEKELAALKGTSSVVAGKAALEGHWLLPGRNGSNIIYVNYNQKDRLFYGTVIKSDNLICHPPGTILFSVSPSRVSDTQFSGIEHGYDYNSATGTCRPVKAKLSISVNGSVMSYNNGTQRLVLNRQQAAPRSPSIPMNQRDSRDDFDAFGNYE